MFDIPLSRSYEPATRRRLFDILHAFLFHFHINLHMPVSIDQNKELPAIIQIHVLHPWLDIPHRCSHTCDAYHQLIQKRAERCKSNDVLGGRIGGVVITIVAILRFHSLAGICTGVLVLLFADH